MVATINCTMPYYFTNDPVHDWNNHCRELDRNGVTLDEWDRQWEEEHGRTEEKKDMIKVIYKEPGKDPEVREVSNTLETFQALVGGYIETVPITAGTTTALVVCNDEGKLNDMKANIWVPGGDVIFGPVVIVGDDGEDFGDAPIEPFLDLIEIEKMYDYFNKNHSRFD